MVVQRIQAFVQAPVEGDDTSTVVKLGKPLELLAAVLVFMQQSISLWNIPAVAGRTVAVKDVAMLPVQIAPQLMKCPLWCTCM